MGIVCFLLIVLVEIEWFLEIWLVGEVVFFFVVFVVIGVEVIINDLLMLWFRVLLSSDGRNVFVVLFF